MIEPNPNPPETFGGAWCPKCGQPIESSDLLVDDFGWCQTDGQVAVEYSAPIVGFAVETALGETWAIRPTREAAEHTIKTQAASALDDAYSCGHPRAGAWCNSQEPFRVVPLTWENREDVLADGTPYLDREPDDDDIYRYQT